MLSTGNVIVNY